MSAKNGLLPLYSLYHICLKDTRPRETIDFVLPWLLFSQPCTKYYFPHRKLFQFFSPHRPATWAGRRAGSPVSVSLTVPVMPMWAMGRMKGMACMKCESAATTGHSSGTEIKTKYSKYLKVNLWNTSP